MLFYHFFSRPEHTFINVIKSKENFIILCFWCLWSEKLSTPQYPNRGGGLGIQLVRI